MKINSNQKGHEELVVRGYKDIFEQFNDDVSNLVKSSVAVLTGAKKKQDMADSAVQNIKTELDRVNKEIDEANHNISAQGVNKENNVKALIEQLRQRAIDSSVRYDEDELNIARQGIQTSEYLAKTAMPDISYEQVLANLQNASVSDVECRNAYASIMNDIGRNYGVFPTDGTKWTKEFSNLYRQVSASANTNSDIVEMMGNSNKDGQAIVADYNENYRGKNPYKIKKILMMLFALPVHTSFRLLNRSGNARNIDLSTSVAALGAGFVIREFRAPVIVSAIIWLIEMLILFNEPNLLIFAGFILAGFVALYFLSKKNVEGYVASIIYSYIYYQSVAGSGEEIAQKEYQRMTDEVRANYTIQADHERNKLEAMEKENQRLREQAARDFNPDRVDKSTLEAEYNRNMKSLRDGLDRLSKKQQEVKDRLNKALQKQAEVQGEFNKAKATVEDYMYNGLPCSETNGLSNSLMGVENRKFIYTIAYSNVYAIINGMHINNIFGKAANGVNYSNPFLTKDDAYGGIGDLGPKTIPVMFKKIDIASAISKLCPDDPSIANVIQSIVDKVADDFLNDSHLSNKSEYVNSVKDLDKFDLHNLYFITTATHNLKCSLMLYDSTKDPDYVYTISRLIYERFFKATYLTANPKAFRHHFVVKDTNYFNEGNIATLSKSAGVANEVITDIVKTNVYDIVEKNKYEEMLKNVKRQGEEFRDKVAEISANSLEEYIIKTKAKGSAPYMCDYLYLWLEPDVLCNDTLIDILHQTGGSKSVGASEASDNKFGVVPFIFIDKAEVFKEKPDRTKLKAIEQIADAISYDNFFEIGAGANTLVNTNRDAFLNKVRAVSSTTY